MKDRIFFCCFVVTTTVVMATYVWGQERAAQPVYQEGECWVFSWVSKNYISSVSGVLTLRANGDHKICFSQSKFFEVDGDAKSPISTASVWNGILYMAENRFFKFPLIVGQNWTEKYNTRVRGTVRTEWRNSELQILGMEDITTWLGLIERLRYKETIGVTAGWWINGYISTARKRNAL